jgi:hypothetical protein
MHRNPLARGLVNHPKDWPWSSSQFYAMAEPGLVGIDIVPEGRRGRRSPSSTPQPEGGALDLMGLASARATRRRSSYLLISNEWY